MKSEACLVPVWKRPELLYCCLKRIRLYQPGIPIYVFPDRGKPDAVTVDIADTFDASLIFVGDHNYYGNSYCTMEAYRFAYNIGAQRIYLVESDVMIHRDFFMWHRTVQEEYEGIFASMAWVFNRHAPISDDVMFQPWYYSIGTCFSREMLALVVEHACPKYYEDMAGYVRARFKDSPLNDPQNVAHYEQDGALQRVMDEHKLSTASAGIAKCSHMGFVRSYGDEGAALGYEELFRDTPNTFEARVERVEQLIADPYERIYYFGKEIVERELGRGIPERTFKYRVSLPNGFSTEFSSPLSKAKLPMMIHSAPIPPDARIEQL